MTTKLVKWVSNGGQITENGQSHGRKANFLPSVAEIAYNWLRIEGYLGNVSCCKKGENTCRMAAPLPSTTPTAHFCGP